MWTIVPGGTAIIARAAGRVLELPAYASVKSGADLFLCRAPTLAVMGPRFNARRGGAVCMPPQAAAVRAMSSGESRSSPLKDPAIAAAIEQARAAQAAAKPEKFGRSLMETLRDHRDELFNIFLAALLVVLTLKMLREKVCAPPAAACACLPATPAADGSPGALEGGRARSWTKSLIATSE